MKCHFPHFRVFLLGTLSLQSEVPISKSIRKDTDHMKTENSEKIIRGFSSASNLRSLDQQSGLLDTDPSDH